MLEGLSPCVKAPVISAHMGPTLAPTQGVQSGCWRPERGTNRASIQPRLDGSESHLYGAQTD